MILTIICMVFAPKKNYKETLKEFDIDHVMLGGEVQRSQRVNKCKHTIECSGRFNPMYFSMFVCIK